MIDLAEEWRRADLVRRAPDSAEHWNMRSATYAKGAHSDYVAEFLNHLSLSERCMVLDMGCGTGSLALPLAQQGHGVIAADFSEGMLERLCASAHAKGVLLIRDGFDTGIGHMDLPETGGYIIPVHMSWQDDWASFGLGERSVDVALASRSIITHDLEDSLAKLSAVARKKVCVTAGTGISPRVDPVIARVMGVTLKKHNDALFVFGIASDLGYEPEVRYIHSPRTRVYTSMDEAYHALLDTLEYVDDHAEQVDPALAAQRLQQWLEEHLIPAKDGDGWCLDEPHIVPWAFISWAV